DLLFVILLIYVSIRFLYLGITDQGSVKNDSRLIQEKDEKIFKNQIGTLPSNTECTHDEHFYIFKIRWISYLMFIVLSMPIFVSIGFIFFIEDMKIYFYFKIETLRLLKLFRFYFLYLEL
ncbi:hypothetical protein LEP1GSC116_4586, partial [Leptospira interrogans serovar Icterohaemorrhagiae str. Verdun HP]